MTHENDFRDLCREGLFEHYISLGRGCYIAIELEQLGLRDVAMPFDWNGTRWRAIERAITTGFEEYLCYDKLYQKKAAPHIYKDIDYGVSFVHDFVSYLPLRVQFKKVEKKYERRIDRFYLCMKQPCLFLRYCWDLEEVKYIANNYQKIEQLIKKENPLSEIVFITHEKANDEIIQEIKNLFFVDIDADEELNTKPITSNEELYDILYTAKYQKKKDNFCFLEDKKTRNKMSTISKRMKRRIIKLLSRYTYHHNQQY